MKETRSFDESEFGNMMMQPGAMPPIAQAIARTMAGGAGGGAAVVPPSPATGDVRSPIGSATGAPPPTGEGAMNTGDSEPKTALSSAIVWLATVKDHFPAMRDMIDGWIATLKTQANPGAAGAMGASLTPPIPTPAPPDIPAPDVPPTPPAL